MCSVPLRCRYSGLTSGYRLVIMNNGEQWLTRQRSIAAERERRHLKQTQGAAYRTPSKRRCCCIMRCLLPPSTPAVTRILQTVVDASPHRTKRMGKIPMICCRCSVLKPCQLSSAHCCGIACSLPRPSPRLLPSQAHSIITSRFGVPVPYPGGCKRALVVNGAPYLQRQRSAKNYEPPAVAPPSTAAAALFARLYSFFTSH